MSDKAPDAFRTISEVADELDLPQHVLRFWESKFTAIRPMKRGGGRRYYRPNDVDLLRGIRFLLYTEGYTIKGVQKILKQHGVRHVMSIWESEEESEPETEDTELEGTENEEFGYEDDEDSTYDDDDEDTDEDVEEDDEDSEYDDEDEEDDDGDEDEGDDDYSDTSADFVPESPLRPQQRIPLRSSELRGGGLTSKQIARLREALSGLREVQSLLEKG